jgi:hypothetical protein
VIQASGSAIVGLRWGSSIASSGAGGRWSALLSRICRRACLDSVARQQVYIKRLIDFLGVIQ